MYLRPRQIFEKFLIAKKKTRIDEVGRQRIEFTATGEEILGVVSTAEPKEIEKWSSLKHEITHEIIQRLGAVKANVGDVLIKEDKHYLVQAVDNPAGLGQWYIYYCLERADLK